MKLKTLLLGSAAAMVAVSGARAADAVIAEPENVEYVRVCDLYGAGFFYIPGTETCLKLSGEFRIQYEINEAEDFEARGAARVRARINFDARNETDLGTLRSFIRLQNETDSSSEGFSGNGTEISGDNAGTYSLNNSFVSLGGLEFGFGDDFWTQNHQYGYPNNMLDGNYGYGTAIYMEYNYAAGGFGATVGFQTGRGGDGVPQTDNFALDPYVGASYASDLFRVAGTVLYDADFQEVVYKADLRVTPVEGLIVDGWYAYDESGATGYVDGEEYMWGVGASYAVLDNLALGAGYSVADNSNEQFTVGFNYQVVSGMSVLGDYRRTDFEAPGVDERNTYRIRIVRSW